MSHETVIRPTIVARAGLEAEGGSAFLAKLDVLIGASPSEVAVDCSRLRAVNSSQITVLWDARARCSAAGARMCLTYVGPGLERVLRVLDLYDLFEIEKGSEPPLSSAPPAVGAGRPDMAFAVKFTPTVEGISGALEDFRGFLEGLSLPEMCVFDLGTVFYEVATNIREHGGLAADGDLAFSAGLEDGKIRLRFVDSGRPFDPRREAPPFSAREAIKRRQRRGIGLFMVRKLVDSVSYERLSDHNVVSLEKSVRHERETT